jgi:hypothetical protein
LAHVFPFPLHVFGPAARQEKVPVQVAPAWQVGHAAFGGWHVERFMQVELSVQVCPSPAEQVECASQVKNWSHVAFTAPVHVSALLQVFCNPDAEQVSALLQETAPWQVENEQVLLPAPPTQV